MLSKAGSAQAAAKWFIQQEVLDQFRVAKEVEEEEITQFKPFQALESWM